MWASRRATQRAISRAFATLYSQFAQVIRGGARTWRASCPASPTASRAWSSLWLPSLRPRKTENGRRCRQRSLRPGERTHGAVAILPDAKGRTNESPSNAIVAGDDPLVLLDVVKDRVVGMHASDRYLADGATLEGRREADGA